MYYVDDWNTGETRPFENLDDAIQFAFEMGAVEIRDDAGQAIPILGGKNE